MARIVEATADTLDQTANSPYAEGWIFSTQMSGSTQSGTNLDAASPQSRTEDATVHNLPSGRALRGSSTHSLPINDQAPSSEPRYSTRRAIKPRVSLRESCPDLFMDSDEDTSENNLSSTKPITIETDSTGTKFVDPDFQPAQSSSQPTRAPVGRPRKRKPLPLPPKPPSRKTSTPTSPLASATPPPATNARTLFKPPLPRSRRPPVPGSGQFMLKEESLAISFVNSPTDLSNNLANPYPPSPITDMATHQLNKTSSSHPSPPAPGYVPTSSPAVLSKSLAVHVDGSTNSQPFETIIENYLRGQYGEESATHNVQVGQGKIQSHPEEPGRSVNENNTEQTMNPDGGGGSSSMASNPTPISINTTSLDTPNSNSHKRKRSLEPNNNLPSQTLTSVSQQSQIDITLSSTAVTPSQTRRSAPPTPISPSTKRPKYSYTQHPSHWALDGNIVLQIEFVRFKLHRSRLARHSGYFKRVLENPVGEEGIVNLDDTGVKVTDFEVLLDALEDFMDYFYTTPPFSTASSILRAATALSFDKYTNWARRYLTDMWPTTLDRLSTSRIPHAIESLALARECNVPSILKRVLYELVRTPRFGQNLPPIDGGVQPQLSSTDVLVLGTAREELTTLWIDVTAAPCSTGSSLTKGLAICAGGEQNPACTTRDEPRATSAHVRLVASGVFRDFVWNPVCGLQALVDLDWAAEGFCHGCVEMRRAVWRTTREKVWEKLDLLFKLGAVRNA